MAYALINSSGERDYHAAVLKFLDNIESDNVCAVAMVAITDNGPYLSWLATPIDFAAMASMMQAQSTLNYMEGEDDDEDCD